MGVFKGVEGLAEHPWKMCQNIQLWGRKKRLQKGSYRKAFLLLWVTAERALEVW